jgi:hypothetical protein
MACRTASDGARIGEKTMLHRAERCNLQIIVIQSDNAVIPSNLHERQLRAFVLL